MLNKKKNSRTIASLVLVLILALQVLSFQTVGVFANDVDEVSITKMQVEYTTNPVGIDVEKPRFSWNLESDGNSIEQTSYRVVVSSSEAKFNASDYDAWDSTVVESSESVGIAYAGVALEATNRYFWKVIVTTNKGRVADAEMAYWETGLMSTKIDAWDNAKWISASNVNEDISEYTIEYDFQIIESASGFTFAATGVESNMLMWQFNIEDTSKSMFRPHRWGGGPNPITEKDISDVMTLDKQKGWWHVVIEVTKDGNNSKIVTKLGEIGGVATEIDSRTIDATFNLGKIGFRHTKDGRTNEVSQFDNLVIKDKQNKVIFENNFNDDSAKEIFPQGQFADGAIRLENSNFVTASNVTALSSDSYTATPLFRKGFKVEKTIDHARLYATARGIYEFSINGEKVGNDYLAPGWTDYFANFQYQTYDVTDMIADGDNAIGAMLGTGWFSSNTSILGNNYYKNISLGQSLLGKLEITYTDGTTEVIVTNDTWKTTPGPVVACDNFDGETYDARREVENWNMPNLDDSSWKNVSIVPHFSGGNADINISAQVGPGIQQIDTLKVKEMTEPQPGQYTYDFGQNMVGIPKIKFKGEAGTVVKIRYAEMLNTENANNQVGNGDGPAGTVYTASLRTAKAIDYYTLKGDLDGEIYTPLFTFHGFRYMEISGLSEAVPADDIEGIVISSNNDMTGDFETSADKVNQLYSNILWSQRGNFVSIPTDCPQRDERMGWTGDTQVFARTGNYIMNANQFYSKWLADLRNAQSTQTGDSHGASPDVVPYVNIVGFGANGWGDAAVIVPWELYQQYGDVEIIRDSYQSMKDWLEFLNRHSTNYVRPNGGYGDWLAPEGTPSTITNTLFTAYVNKLFSKMAGAVEETTDANIYAKRSEDIMEAFFESFGKEDGTINVNTQTPYAMALYFDLIPEAKKDIFAKILKDNIKDHDWHLTTGFVGINLLAPSLSENGQIDAAYKLLEQDTFPSWIYSIDNGATTLWERWNSFTIEDGFGPTDMNSFNHYAFGAIGEWMFSGILGIQRDEANPGYKNFSLKPLPGGSLTYAKGSFDSVYGMIESDWKISGDLFEYNCSVPANTTATIYLPTNNVESLVSALPEGATIKGIENGSLAIEVGSGKYSFTIDYNAEFSKTKFITISNTQRIDSKVIINGEEYSLPLNKNIPETLDEILVVSNDSNYEFSHWTGDIASNYNPLTLANLSDGVAINANFKYIGGATDDEQVTIAYDLIEATGILNGTDIGGTGQIIVDKGTDSSFDIKPPTGKQFVGWEAPFDKLDNPAFFVANETILAKPIFEAPIYYKNYALNKTVTTNDTMDASGWGISNLTDGTQTGIGWTTNSTNYTNGIVSPTVYAEIDLEKNELINEVILYPRTDSESFKSDAHYFPRDFTISIKADGASDYTVVKTVVDHADTAEPQYFSFDEAQARYVRIEFTKTAEKFTDRDMYRLQLAEVEVRNEAPGIQSIEIDAENNEQIIAVGDIVNLSAIVGPSNAYSNDITWYIRELDGTISDKGEAIVSGDSIEFTALKVGKVEIVAYADDNFGAVGRYSLNISDGELGEAVFSSVIVDNKFVSTMDNGTDKAITGAFHIVIYDLDGRMVYSEGSEFTVDADDVVEHIFSIAVNAYNPEQYTYKAFCWDEGFAPIAEAIVIK